VSYSPKFAFILGVIENVVLLFMMMYNKVNTVSLVAFSIIIFTFKVIPLYIIRTDSISVTDVIFTLMLFNLHLMWLLVNGQDFYKTSVKIVDSLTHDKNETPMMYYLKELRNEFKY
jgi:hypothetical protein